MPHQPALKLCGTCDQLSLVRTTSRDLRCNQPVAWKDGRPCRSRHVQVLSLAAYNDLRRQEKAAYEGRLGDLEAKFEAMELRADLERASNEERIAKLQSQVDQLLRAH